MISTIKTTTVTVTTTGSAGSATGSGSSGLLNGELLDVYLNFHASAPATTDTTISETTFGSIMVKTDSSTDARYAPRMATHGPTATALTWYDRYPLSDSIITISLAQCDALTGAVVATIRWLSY